MVSWLPVIEGEGEEPRVIDQGLEPDLVYARPPELVAWGSVDAVPWRIQAAVTAPGPEAKWWDHGPVGPELVFMLGRDDAFGGGEVNTHLNGGTHLSASIDFFGSHPAIVAWVGVVSNDVAGSRYGSTMEMPARSSSTMARPGSHACSGSSLRGARPVSWSPGPPTARSCGPNT